MGIKRISRVNTYKILLIGIFFIFLVAYVFATAPTQNTPTIDSSDPDTNNTFADLIVTNQSTTDSDGDIVYNSIRWYLNNETNISSIKPDDPNLILFMPMDGNSTEELMDYAGADDNGSFNGAVDYNNSCQVNGCYNFSGDTLTNSYIQIPDSAVLTPSYYDGFSIVLSVYFDSFTAPDANSQKIIAKGGPDASNYEWEIRKADGADGLGFNLFQNDGSAHCTANSLGGSVPVKTWKRVVAVYNNDTNCSLYVDGFSSGSVANVVASTRVSDRSGPVDIGIRGDGAGEFAGLVDDIAIFNRTLTDDEIYTDYMIHQLGGYSLNSTYTSVGDFWSAELTPWDYTTSGTSQNTSELEILCLQPTDGLSLSSDTTFCAGGNYNLNGTLNGNAITLTNNNMILDCANSIIFGNWSRSDNENTYIGIGLSSGVENVTVQNCQLKQYQHGFRLPGSNNNITLDNVQTDDIKNGIYLTNANNSYVINSYFNNDSNYHIYNENSAHMTYDNNTFSNTTQYGINLITPNEYVIISGSSFDEGGVISTSYNHTVIERNNFTGRRDNTVYTIMLDSGGYNNVSTNEFSYSTILNANVWLINETNSNVFDNQFINNSQSTTSGNSFDIVIGNDAKYINIFNNSFFFHDSAIRITSGQELHIYDNIFNYSVSDRDGYGSSLVFDGRPNFDLLGVYIYNNTFDNMGTSAIMLRHVNNSQIENNTINFLPISELSNYPIRNGGEARCGTSIIELWKTWLGDSSESGTDTLANKIGGYSSDNITIINNFYDSNTQCYIQTQGTTNLTQDLGSFWFVSHQTPTFLVDRTDMYLNTAFDNLTSKNRTNDISDMLSQGWMNPEIVYYQIHQDYIKYQFVNDTITSFYNLTGNDFTLSNKTTIYNNITGNLLNINFLTTETLNVSTAIPCNPVSDASWVISDDRFCANSEDINLGKGNITILPGGFLTLTQGTNITVEHLEQQRTGDAVAINKGSELIIKGSK